MIIRVESAFKSSFWQIYHIQETASSWRAVFAALCSNGLLKKDEVIGPKAKPRSLSP